MEIPLIQMSAEMSCASVSMMGSAVREPLPVSASSTVARSAAVVDMKNVPGKRFTTGRTGVVKAKVLDGARVMG